MKTTDIITVGDLQKKHKPLLHRTSIALVIAMLVQYIPAVALSAAGEAGQATAKANGGRRAFGQTAAKGGFDVKAVKESGEYGGALTPTTERPEKFTKRGNEAFGACMQKWNRHDYAEAAADMERFIAENPGDPWAGEAELHVACNCKYNHEYAAAESRLVGLYEQNKGNPVGRKALVRLGHLYYQTFRYQESEEVFRTLLGMNPIEEEKSYAINWLFHIQRAWAMSALNRECGPQSFGYAAWLVEHSGEVDRRRGAEKARRAKRKKEQAHPAYLPALGLNGVYKSYPWAATKGGDEGMSLASIRTLLASNGWELNSRHATYGDLVKNVSEDHPLVLCLPPPAEARFQSPEQVAEYSKGKIAELKKNGGRYDVQTGHYAVLLKASSAGGWVLDSERGMVFWSASRIKELWMQGERHGLVAWVEKDSMKPVHPRLMGNGGVLALQEAAFKGGCCGTPQQNDDNGCGSGGGSGGNVSGSGAGGAGGGGGYAMGYSRGMPEYSVNIYNLNYLLTDTPLWCETPRGPGLYLTLKYNNRETNNARYPIEDVQFYPFGFRWSGSYDARYYYEPGDRYLVRFPNGMEVYFDGQGGGTYLPESRYLDHFEFTILPDQRVKVDVRKGMSSYYFHPLNTPMQQTLSRIEDRFGDGVDITRDGDTNSATYGCMLEVRSDATDSAFHYQHNGNGNITNVYETANSGGGDVATGRHAAFTYEVAGTNANTRLESITDMGGYTTTFENGTQTYVASPNGPSVTSDHHVVSMTWPNNGEWKFDLFQMHKADFDEPLMLKIEDPEGGVQTYYFQAPYAYGPFTAEDRNGIGNVKSFGTTGTTTTHDIAQLVNNDNIHATKGDMLVCKELSANGRDILSYRQLFEADRINLPGSSSSAYSQTDDLERKDKWYSYTSTNGHRIVTLTNEVYEMVGASVTNTGTWVETVEQDENLDAVRLVDRGNNTVYLDRTNRLVNAVRILPDGGTEKTVYQATYNNHGQLTSYTTDEGLQNTVSNVYDSAGALRQVLYPDGTSEGFDYDPATFFMVEYTNRTGKVVAVNPDDMGRPLDIDYPDGTGETLAYGCCAADAFTDRYGTTSNYGYNGNKRMDWAVVPMDAETDTHLAFGYLGEGELESLGYGPSDDELATRTFGYLHEDGETRLQSRNTPEGKTPKKWTYHFSGLPETMTDGRGVVTTYEWNQGKEQLKKKTVDGSAAGLETVTVDYGHDGQDRLTNVVKNVSGLGDILSETYGYDEHSRIETVDTTVNNIPGQTSALEYTVEYNYGNRGFVTNRTVSVGGSQASATAYTYAPDSARLKSVVDDFASTQYGFDQYGRLKAQTNSIVGASSSQTVKTWGYDEFSKLTSLSISNATSLLWGNAFGYDVERINAITNTVDGSRWSYGYDYQGQLKAADLYSSSNTLVHVERYKFDAVGNVTHKGIAGEEADIQLGSNADDEAVEYQRHKTATMIGTIGDTNAVLSLPISGTDVVQDDNGNWIAPLVPLYPMSNGNVRIQLKAEVAGQNDTYKLAAFSVFPTSTNLSYDANGALLSLPDGTNTAFSLSWNAEGRLASVSSVQTNWYDDTGRRIAKVEGGTLFLYLWAGMDEFGVANSSASITEYYTRGIGIAGDVGTLVASHDFGSSTTTLLHANHRGDVVLATDTAGAVVHEAEFTPFGNVLAETGTYSPRFGFSSKERDASSLIYYGYRSYSPELCQWVCQDPAGERGGINLYRFCRNNPINYVDTDGRLALAVVIAIAKGVAYAVGTIAALIGAKKFADRMAAAAEKRAMVDRLTEGMDICLDNDDIDGALELDELRKQILLEGLLPELRAAAEQGMRDFGVGAVDDKIIGGAL